MVGLENQNESYCFDFLAIMAYIIVRKQKMDVWRASSQNGDTTSFVE
jgi:hypothetical protein